MCKASSKWKWFKCISESKFSQLYLFTEQISDANFTCEPNNRKYT